MTAVERPGPSTNLQLEEVLPDSDPRWPALIERAGGGLFHSRPWLRAVAETYGFRIRVSLVTTTDGTPVGGLAHCRVDDLLGSRIVAVPFTDCHDPLITDPAAWLVLAGAIVGSGLPVQLRTLDPHYPPDDGRWAVTKRARWHRVTLGDTPEADWARFEEGTRRAVRKARRMQVAIRPLEGEAGVRAFHALHVALRKSKHRLLAQPPGFFEALRRQFEPTGDWHPLGAFVGDRLMAATVFLRRGDTLYYKFNASDPEGLPARPNDMLVDAGLGLARGLGCRALDLGPSDDDQPGLIRFKRGFGADDRELRFVRHVPPGWSDPAADLRRMLGGITRLFTEPQVPDAVAARAGAALYRFFA